MKIRNTPPSFFLRFFRWFCHPKLKNHIEGDLMELYYEREEESGKKKADVKFVIDVLLLFRPGIIRPAERSQNLNHYGMIKSYFKIGWRNLLKNKGYSFINIVGLALGMTVALLVGLWISDELSFNKYHQNYEQVAGGLKNTSNINDNIISVDFRDFQGFYLFNSFYENLDPRHGIDKKIALSAKLYESYGSHVSDKLRALPSGIRLATYYTDNWMVPKEFELVYNLFDENLKLWEKVV